MIFHDFWNDDKKRSEFGLGSAFFGISEVDFLPYGVQIKGVIEKGLIFDEKLKMMKKQVLGTHAVVEGGVLSNGMCPEVGWACGSGGMFIPGHVARNVAGKF